LTFILISTDSGTEERRHGNSSLAADAEFLAAVRHLHQLHQFYQVVDHKKHCMPSVIVVESSCFRAAVLYYLVTYSIVDRCRCVHWRTRPPNRNSTIQSIFLFPGNENNARKMATKTIPAEHRTIPPGSEATRNSALHTPVGENMGPAAASEGLRISHVTLVNSRLPNNAETLV
jgi:hypothetical protein